MLTKGQRKKRSIKPKSGLNGSPPPPPPKVEGKATQASAGDEGASRSTARTRTYDLRSIQVGRRVAMTFGDELKFGEVEASNVSRTAPPSDWDWQIGLDDGETFEVDCDEMRKALAAYDRLHGEEAANPVTPVTKAAIVAAFQIKKEIVMGLLPPSYKALFLEPGFARWEDEFLPVLFIGPYDISEGPLRETFFRKIKNAANGLLALPRLVYWYGVDDLEKAFSFVPQEECLTYEEGLSKGLLELPKDIQTKLDQGGTITNAEKARIHGRDLIQEDREKRKEGRRRFPKFEEDHKYILNGERMIAEIQAERVNNLLEWGV